VMDESLQKILARRSQQAEANRRQMPVTSGIVDELRANQGDPPFSPRVTFAEEGGQTVGKPLPQGVVPVLARKSDPETSKAAAEKVDQFRAKHEALIFDAISKASMKLPVSVITPMAPFTPGSTPIMRMAQCVAFSPPPHSSNTRASCWIF